MHKQANILFLCAIIFFPYAQLVAQHLYFHQLNRTLGLSDDFNAHFTVDRSMIFWTSGRMGLNRFDGKNIKTYRPDLINSSLDPNVTSRVFEDKKGGRWFTSNNAIMHLPPGTDTLEYFQLKNFETGYYYAFHLERDSFLWLTVQDQLFVFPVFEPQSILQPRHYCQGFVIYPLLNTQGTVTGLARPLIEHGSGLEIIRYTEAGDIRRRDSFLVTSSGRTATAVDTSIFYFHIEHDSSFWIPSTVGLIHFNPYQSGPRQIYRHQQNSLPLTYLDIQPWKEHFFWLISRSGQLLLFDRKLWEFVQVHSSFQVGDQIKNYPTFNKLYIDPEENLWISSFNEGIIHTSLSNRKFSQLLPLDFLHEQETCHVNSIIEDENGGFLVAILERGVYRIIPDQYGQYEIIKLKLSCCRDADIYSLYKDSSGDIWIIDDQQITLWDRTDNTFIPQLKRPPYTYQVIQLTPEKFLLLTMENVLLIRKSKKPAPESEAPPLFPDGNSNSKLYYDTLSKLAFLSQNTNVLRVFEPQLPAIEHCTVHGIGHINGFFRSKCESAVWLASSTGLYQYDIGTASVEKIRAKDNELKQSFTAVVEDAHGAVWLSSFWGVFKFEPTSGTVEYFSESDGLGTMQYYENIWLEKGGDTILFGGKDGITMILPDSVRPNFNLPHIVPLEAKVAGELYPIDIFLNEDDPVSLPYRQNSITFSFAAVEYSDPTQNVMYALLLKDGSGVIDSLMGDFINLSNLSSGNYQLHTYAVNNDKVKMQTPHIVSFRIRPPWYRTWWAIFLWILLLIAVFDQWYKYRIRRIQKKEVAKRREAELKQQQAELKQLTAETELAVLKLQMNPHFIFNSMNSINSYIVQKDIHTASTYLHLFAMLMRRILELSEYTYVDLTEEIAFLKLYLDTENMRMGKKMNYEFEVARDLDPDETLIQTMILQPFVENAIWHGLSPKLDGGKITIRFYTSALHLFCEVEDDGVGRPKEQGILKTYVSKAIEITQRRLELLASETNTAAKLEIIDLQNKDDSPAGTKVVLMLPLL